MKHQRGGAPIPFFNESRGHVTEGDAFVVKQPPSAVYPTARPSAQVEQALRSTTTKK